MLEFIVLGIVPGTHFHITYSWVLIFAALFLVVLEIRYHKNYALKVQLITAAATASPPSALIKPQKKRPSTAAKKAKKTKPAAKTPAKSAAQKSKKTPAKTAKKKQKATSKKAASTVTKSVKKTKKPARQKA